MWKCCDVIAERLTRRNLCENSPTQRNTNDLSYRTTYFDVKCCLLYYSRQYRNDRESLCPSFSFTLSWLLFALTGDRIKVDTVGGSLGDCDECDWGKPSRSGRRLRGGSFFLCELILFTRACGICDYHYFSYYYYWSLTKTHIEMC